jgi:hypothetical protein
MPHIMSRHADNDLFRHDRTVQRLGVAALADVVPYCTVKALDHDKPNRRVLVDALVQLIHIPDEPGNAIVLFTFQ